MYDLCIIYIVYEPLRKNSMERIWIRVGLCVVKPHAGVNDGVIDDMNDIEPTYEIVNGTFPVTQIYILIKPIILYWLGISKATIYMYRFLSSITVPT